VQGGTFEVTKNTSPPSDVEGGAVPGNPLQVIIPSELEGSAYVQLEIKAVPGNMSTLEGLGWDRNVGVMETKLLA